MAGPDFHFDEASHTYTLGGAVIPSVTQVLKPIAPDFSMVPPAVLERKRAIGVAVHLACELDDEGDLGECDAVLMPYVEAWRKFRADAGALVLMNERRLFHPTLRYAGTLDRLVTMRGDVWMIDLKTSADPVPSYGAQTAAYVELIRANEEDARGFSRGHVRRASVHLRDDGSYRLHEFKDPNDWPAFMACLALHNWKESNK